MVVGIWFVKCTSSLFLDHDRGKRDDGRMGLLFSFLVILERLNLGLVEYYVVMQMLAVNLLMKKS